MMTSTTSEITPIIAVQGKKIGTGKPGPVTRRLQAAFEEKLNLNR
jgi:D-alanine transaminase